MKYVKFFGNAGYVGTDYEEWAEYDDDVTEEEINTDSRYYAYDNAETFEYVAKGWDVPWNSEEECDEYYENALEYSGWSYCSKKEYDEMK